MSEKVLKLLSLIALVGIAVGVGLLAKKIFSSLQYQVVSATISGVEESPGACRRRTGKMESCQHYDVTVSFVGFDNQNRSAQLTTENKRLVPQVGDSIKVFVNTKNTDDVRVDVLREGWSVPLGMLGLSVLVGIIVRARRPKFSSLPDPS